MKKDKSRVSINSSTKAPLHLDNPFAKIEIELVQQLLGFGTVRGNSGRTGLFRSVLMTPNTLFHVQAYTFVWPLPLHSLTNEMVQPALDPPALFHVLTLDSPALEQDSPPQDSLSDRLDVSSKVGFVPVSDDTHFDVLRIERYV